ncbi:RNA polymerase sigma factor [Egicoccus sp. AB-alg2]|uniref:RNA polymerase sigma factor n=1 Tax=Egicoccus sp. AB-alg2 TaxID=3242693 RepID=UPI00359DACC1
MPSTAGSTPASGEPGAARDGSIWRTASLGSAFPRTLRAARRGRQAAWDALYRDLAPSLLGYARAQHAPDPEDLVGEVFLEVVRSLPRLADDDEDAFRAWVFTIARRRLIDARRAASRRPVEPAAPEDLAAVAGGFEEDALARLSRDEVLALLDRLSDDQREVLVLRLVAGLRTPEIARVTDRHPEAVKGLAKRGLARLRELIATDARSADDDGTSSALTPPPGPDRR